MYPAQELIRLAAHKAALRRRIAWHRVKCAEAAAQVSRPLAWLDRMRAYWRQLSPFARFAAVPLGFLVKRKVFPRVKILGALLRWGPLIFSALRGITSAAKTRSRSAHDRSRVVPKTMVRNGVRQ